MATNTRINGHSNRHTSKQFDNELEAIHAGVLVMGGLVENQVRDAIDSLVNGNVALMTRVIGNDQRVNAMEVRIDEICTQVIARRQPTANDLRFVMTVIKAITDLERIGDEAKKIACIAKMLSFDLGLSTPRYNEVERASEIILDMLSKSLDAFARLDVSSAEQVVHLDDRVDDEFHAIMRKLISFMMKNPHTISNTLEMLFVAKAIERIGEHARNLAEYVIYMVEGRAVRRLAADDQFEHEAPQQASNSLFLSPQSSCTDA